MVVLPPDYIPELNTLSQNVINSRKSHSTTLLGHLNGINVVLETSFHVKILLNKVTPSLPHFFKPAALRIQETLSHEFPQSTTEWTAVEPLDRVALCISRAMTLMIFGAPTCDKPELIRAFVDHAENGNSSLNLSSLISTKDYCSFLSRICHATSSLGSATVSRLAMPVYMAPEQDLEISEGICYTKSKTKLGGETERSSIKYGTNFSHGSFGQECSRS